MKLQTFRRQAGIATAVLALSVSLAACSDDEADTTGTDETTSETTPEETPSQDAEADASEGTFGDACADVPEDGPGSFNGMVQDPVATAAGNNPLLSTLVAAVGAVPGLGDTLNSAEGLTVFAPANPAFDAIPQADLENLLASPKKLGPILQHHVVGERLDPEAVVGEHDTLNGDTVTVEGDTEGMTVDGAQVLCGNVQTANATVYIIDTVLSPPA